jgi:hypothetical protein
MEQILIDSFLDGVDRLGENFATILQQDLNFEQKGRIIEVIGFEIIENSLPYIEDPENLEIDEVSFDFCLSKIILSEVLTELVKPGAKPPPSQLTARQRYLRKSGMRTIRSGIKIDRAATKQIGANRQRLFGQGKGTVAGSLVAAKNMAKSRSIGGAAAAAGHLVGAGARAARGALGLATGGARKVLSRAVMARGRQLKGSPYKSWAAQQRRKKAREETQTYYQRHANVPGV